MHRSFTTTTTTRLPAPIVVLDRREVTRRAGATIAEIVAEATPGMPPAIRSTLRVVLVTEAGAEVITAETWTRVKPRAGVRVVIRSVPTGSGLRSLLMIVVAIAAVFLGQLWAPFLTGFGLSSSVATTLITVGVTAVGMLLINALVPLRRSSDDKEYGGYSVNGWKNSSNPDGPIPAPLGRLRMAPYYAAPPYTEIVGDDQYMRVVFVWGYGPLALSDFKFGDTSIGDYDEVAIEHRYGWPDDEQLTLYTGQVIEEGLSIELTRAWEKNDDGSYKSGGVTIEKPQIRYTASDVTEAAVILGWPGGLCYMDGDGNRQNRSVYIRIRQRPLGGDTWEVVDTLYFVAAKTVPFWRAHRWVLPSRGAWEIELTRMSDESTETHDTDRTVWQALQSFRPEYPIDFDHPLALTAMRVKATAQLNGTIDNFTGIVSRIAPDWDAATSSWITRETRSPAAALRWILQGPASAYPVADASIDLDLLADWSAWCAGKGLHYDKVHDAEASLADALLSVAHGGRATPRHDGIKWGVVVDRPSDLVVDHINPRNSRGFRWTRVYPKHPDGFRVKFQDSTNDWKTSERIIPWPGHTGDIIVTEQLELPGKCDPDEIWIEARRRMYEIEHRPDTFEATQDGLARVATRGDVVAVSTDTLVRTQTAGRVASVSGALVELDEEIDRTGAGDVDYAVRFRVFAGDEDVIGASIVRRIARFDGRSKLLRLIGSGSVPATGDIVHVGPVAAESLLCRVRGEERGTDGAVIYHLVASAPEIDTLTDAEVPPAWDGRAGATYTGGGESAIPAAPVIESVATGVVGTGDADGLTVRLHPGTGSVAVVGSYRIETRLVGGTTWAETTTSASSGGADIAGYHAGDDVEIRVLALSIYGVASDYGPVVSTTIGADDVVVPDVIAITVTHPTSGIRVYDIETAASDVEIAGWRLRARPGSGWSWADLAPLHTGLVAGTPWVAAAPIAAGIWTIGAVAVAMDGTIGAHPYEITTTLPALVDTGTRSDRIESALSWPGSVTGGSILSGVVVGTAAGTDLVYVAPIIDLGADVTVDVAAAVYGVVGTAMLSMRVGTEADGEPVGAAGPLGQSTARYISIIATIVDTTVAPRLGDLVSLVRTPS